MSSAADRSQAAYILRGRESIDERRAREQEELEKAERILEERLQQGDHHGLSKASAADRVQAARLLKALGQQGPRTSRDGN